MAARVAAARSRLAAGERPVPNTAQAPGSMAENVAAARAQLGVDVPRTTRSERGAKSIGSAISSMISKALGGSKT